MTDPTDREAYPLISRREAIRRAALAVGVVVSPAWLASVDGSPAVPEAQAAAGLSGSQMTLTAAIAERILPRTSTPGAIDAGVPAFIDVLYRQFMTPEERARFADGLAAVDQASRAARGVPFASLAAGDQDEILRGVARASEREPNSFFLQIRSATILGYFTSEEVGKNVLHYDPIPGRYDACVPVTDVGNINWTT
ncbi:MAG: gluconate 2-dehydrogenase subunit 3 family protein [Acidobacteria bacterium]|nr:gluconate 2-dehydrogenase subunit 3 family protein [Acidobacteriota bacterium]